jgi:hypothetical protein
MSRTWQEHGNRTAMARQGRVNNVARACRGHGNTKQEHRDNNSENPAITCQHQQCQAMQHHHGKSMTNTWPGQQGMGMAILYQTHVMPDKRKTHTWRDHRITGKTKAISCQEHGKNKANAWQHNGNTMARHLSVSLP